MPIRPATTADIPALIAIYNQAITDGHSTAHLTPISPTSTTFLTPTNSHPVFLDHTGPTIRGWCALRPYRPGRQALANTAEIAYYIDRSARRQGIASALITHAIAACPTLGITTILAVLLDTNTPSIALLEKHAFTRWGHLPNIATLPDNTTCGQYLYGHKIG